MRKISSAIIGTLMLGVASSAFADSNIDSGKYYPGFNLSYDHTDASGRVFAYGRRGYEDLEDCREKLQNIVTAARRLMKKNDRFPETPYNIEEGCWDSERLKESIDIHDRLMRAQERGTDAGMAFTDRNFRVTVCGGLSYNQ
jgi:hypothetical protein